MLSRLAQPRVFNLSGLRAAKRRVATAASAASSNARFAVGAAAAGVLAMAVLSGKHASAEGGYRTKLIADLTKPEEGTSEIIDHPVVFAPDVPPPITRRGNATVRVHITSDIKDIQVCGRYKYRAWTFNGDVPGPFVRVRVGDVLEVHHTNNDTTGMPHNIDFHSVKGPGGGGPLLLAEQGQTKVARFKMQRAGLYVYHCAAAPVPVHVANGMYGLILVEPEWGLPAVEKEFYVMQNEWYPLHDNETPGLVTECNYEAGLNERPELVVFNGRENSLITKPLKANMNERVRIFFGNGGPNLISSFHVIGGIFGRVWREGDLLSEPGKCVQTTLVPAGGSTVVEIEPNVPGTYTLVDHSIFRLDKGCVGFLNVVGDERPGLYASADPPKFCVGCKLHA